MTTQDFVPAKPEDQDWDVIVVGTGMGGSTVGYALAKKGLNVLFLEKGMFLFGNHDRGQGKPVAIDNDPEARLRSGLWPYQLEGSTNQGEIKFYPPTGCGSGGSTSRYGAQLERFAPCDFAPRAHYPENLDSTLPDSWPITYEELLPYYREAENLFRVCGTADPLNPDLGNTLRKPPTLGARDRDFKDSFEELGLNPYRPHIGCRFIEGCLDCAGLCPFDCRSDAGRVCLLPALENHGARLIPECEVFRLQADESRVQQVHYKLNGKAYTVRGKIVVLAAGAFMSPIILLNSKDKIWPKGLANTSDLVGRNLMMHGGDYIAIRPRRQLPPGGPGKALAFNDLYVAGGTKLGTFQSVGRKINTGDVCQFLYDVVDRHQRKWFQLVRPFLRLIAPMGAYYYRNAAVFASILEDLPYHHNRVYFDSNSRNCMRFEYEYPKELIERNRLFRSSLKKILSPNHKISILTPEGMLNYGHPCGTCRFGEDADKSVLDSNNRAHDVENLYVVDASFFPSSGGTNPSLTIAANALRVAEAIIKKCL